MTSKQDSAQNRSTHRPVVRPSLEELLSLKRAERPDEAFWSEFERGMRQKQLAAIIEPRPWWLGMALWWRKASPLVLPLAGGAAVALAVMVIRDAAPSAELAQTAEREIVASTKLTSKEASNPAAYVAVESDSAAGSGRDDKPLAIADPKPDSVTPAVLAAVEEVTLKEATVEAASSGVAPAAAAEAPSAALIQATLEAIKAEPLVAVSGVTGEMLASVADERVVTLARRQERLLAMADMEDASANPETLANLRERMAHRFDSDERRLANASRVGLGVDRLSLRF